ncbi:14694_t:CDS:1, partial [Acaulospora morrowiae]
MSSKIKKESCDLTDFAREHIINLYEAGWTFTMIADHMKSKKTTVVDIVTKWKKMDGLPFKKDQGLLK